MWWLALACSEPEVTPSRRPELQAALASPGVAPDVQPQLGAVWRSEQGYDVRPLTLDLRPGFQVGAALFQPEGTQGRHAVLVANGHFDQAKSGPDTQQIAHRLAARGATVLIVDNPGSEEFGTRDRALHFGRGAHNRAFLHAGGSSALALQVDALRAGLDFLEQRGLDRVVATGASGGAVLSFWLAMLDDRVTGAVMAAAPAVPREPADGCDCKQLFGVPGPDPEAVAALPVPSLWMTESAQRPLEGLPQDATWRVVPGEHAYTPAMQREAIDWIEQHQARAVTGAVWLEDPPLLELRASPAPGPRLGIFDLELQPATMWTPQRSAPAEFSVACEGTGPTVLVLGRGPVPGFRSCVVTLGELAWAVDAGRGRVTADKVVAALRAAAAEHKVQALWGYGGHGVAVAAIEWPFVLEEPRRTPAEVDVDVDPSWMHVPGLWWGGVEALYAEALATGDEAACAAALAGTLR